MIKRFTRSAADVIFDAARQAGRLGHFAVGSEHVLLAISQNRETFASRSLAEHGFDCEKLEKVVVEKYGRGKKCELTLSDFTDECKTVINLAREICKNQNYSYVGTEHLLMAAMCEGSDAYETVKEGGGEPLRIYGDLCSLFDDTEPTAKRVQKQRPSDLKRLYPVLEKYGVCMTEQARRGELGKIAGREREIEKICRILLCKTKNNPVLTGLPGVGKTALVQGLCEYLISDSAPQRLKGFEVYSVSAGSLVAGTKYRGEFEEKLEKIIAECKKCGNIILFIDELHNAVSAGGAEGAVSAGEMLKPPLARGEIKLIGATTCEDYEKTIAADGAFERRFRKIYLAEPDESECIKMLESTKEGLEKFHGVKISPGAVRASVRLSGRFCPERYFPDKAVDLLDGTAAEAALKGRKEIGAHDVSKNLYFMTGLSDFGIRKKQKRLALLFEREKLSGIRAIEALKSELFRQGENAFMQKNIPYCSFLFYGKDGELKSKALQIIAEAYAGGKIMHYDAAAGLFCDDKSPFADGESGIRLCVIKNLQNAAYETLLKTAAVINGDFLKKPVCNTIIIILADRNSGKAGFLSGENNSGGTFFDICKICPGICAVEFENKL